MNIRAKLLNAVGKVCFSHDNTNFTKPKSVVSSKVEKLSDKYENKLIFIHKENNFCNISQLFHCNISKDLNPNSSTHFYEVLNESVEL